VNDALLVRVGECGCDRLRVGRRLAGLERKSRARRLRQVAPVDVLHHQERFVAVRHVVVDANDVLVSE
jgi:hypothetical protein